MNMNYNILILMAIPQLQLSAGQIKTLIWASRIARPERKMGKVFFPPPTATYTGKLNYLRDKGVPFAKGERSPGSGHNLVYNFHHLCELAVAFELLDRGARPQNIAELMLAKRAFIRQCCEHAYENREEEFSFRDPQGVAFGHYLAIDIRYVRENPYLSELKYLNGQQAALHAIAGNHARLLIPLSAVIGNLVEAALTLEPERRGRKPGPR